MLELLIQHGADVNRADETGKTPLHKAVHLGNFNRLSVFKILKSKAAVFC